MPTVSASPIVTTSNNAIPAGATGIVPQNALSSAMKEQLGGSSPTVLSDANIRESVIPSLQAQGNQLTTPQQTTPSQTPNNGTDTGIDSNSSYQDIYNKTFADLDKQPIDSGTQSELDLIKNSMSNVDADTQTMLNGITSNYSSAQTALQQSQNSESAKILNALNLGGGNRYAPVSSSGIMTLKNSADIQQLNDLQTKEDAAKQAAISAGQDKNYQLMEDKLKIYDGIRSDKTALATKITDSINTQNQTIRTQTLQNERDLTISSLLQEGITDPGQILTELSKNGDTTTTSADIAASLKSLSPTDDLSGLTGEVKNFYTLQQRGLLPDTIKNLPANQQLFAYLKQEKAAATITKQASTKVGPTKVPPQSDIQDGVTKLQSARGSDGFVDPYVYKQMYTTWVTAGFSPQAFTSSYPPKYYVNPQDGPLGILPSYLLPPSTKNSSTGTQAP